MKRLIMLAVLCAFVLGAATAQAADIKASGTWVVEAVWNSNWDFLDKAGKDQGIDRDNDSFNVYQRATTTFEFIANENLKGVLETRYGTQKWGDRSFRLGGGDSGDNNSDDNRFTVRKAYIDFNYPDTDVHVRAGYQGVSLPAAFGGGSMILDEEIGAVVVSGAFTDNVGYLAGYGRALSYTDRSNTTTGASSWGVNANGYIDAYIAALPLSFEGISVTPFGMYAPVGSAVVGTAAPVGLLATNATTTGTAKLENAYWLGAAFSMDLFDPFVLKADFNYGKVDGNRKQNEKSGWLFDMALEYKGFDFMTPELFFAYSSGEDGNASKGAGESERMPIVQAANWAVGSFWFGGDRLLAGSLPTASQRGAMLGYWVLGLNLKDIQSFAEGLTHDATILYAKGTNDKDSTIVNTTGTTGAQNITYGKTLTEKDSVFEIDFNTAYKLYDELTLSLDLGYLNYSTKEERWAADGANRSGYKGGDAWKISTGIMYKF